MNDVITLLLGGGLAASIIETVKFFATRRQIKRKDEASSLKEEASADATVGGAWRELWQTGDQWNSKLNSAFRLEVLKNEQFVDLIQEATSHLDREKAEPILDKMHTIRAGVSIGNRDDSL
ncbi:hypothetical protein TIN4_34 [Tsukamurella phage TIN4]|uniref:Uncharacterized protein n=2 Tax=Tinduovirus TIN3 TaxID=1982571 RepID=A0A0K0N5F5_9CAUD|nr:hypothetical protein AVT54_gp091 [Tsukamurella phage TIN3]YP_009604164.1 hypothetical protein FDH87_gp091 [Tsukamurella phage TIN4]AKJ71831.1 hypothetical protein TIN3_34 [Tsukamurella phage TIN3]AKJ71940.1 hypothetical protein TIN4_34 [Tsukamurella phage TIN4]